MIHVIMHDRGVHSHQEHTVDGGVKKEAKPFMNTNGFA